jgi:hypothetical protein
MAPNSWPRSLGGHENDLPGEAVLVFEPAKAFAERVAVQRHEDFAAWREFFPEGIHFVFGGALQVEGNGRIELEKRSGADGHEGLAGKLKGDDVAIAGGSVVKRANVGDLRVWDQRSVKRRCFFGLFVEPKMGSDCSHGASVGCAAIVKRIRGELSRPWQGQKQRSESRKQKQKN